MKFLILSDLHLEFGVPYEPPVDAEYDAVILAGDITSNGDVVSWAASVFNPDAPIVIVPGNHEYYDGTLQPLREKFQGDAGRHANVHVLDPGEIVLADGRIRVLGCTLWTDFMIRVVTRDGPQVHRDYAIEQAWRFMNDYKCIWFEPPGLPSRTFEPHDALALHRAERQWLLTKLQEPFVGDAHVVCNPRGYPSRRRGFENAEFDPRLVVDVSSACPDASHHRENASRSACCDPTDASSTPKFGEPVGCRRTSAVWMLAFRPRRYGKKSSTKASGSSSANAAAFGLDVATTDPVATTRSIGNPCARRFLRRAASWWSSSADTQTSVNPASCSAWQPSIAPSIAGIVDQNSASKQARNRSSGRPTSRSTPQRSIGE